MLISPTFLVNRIDVRTSGKPAHVRMGQPAVREATCGVTIYCCTSMMRRVGFWSSVTR